jgi:secreted trypsin-like serine protease
MLHMLHVSELGRIATRHRVSFGKRTTHKYLYEECSDLMTGREIVAAVCDALRARDAFASGSDAPIIAGKP